MHLSRTGSRSRNGHDAQNSARFCPECGVPLEVYVPLSLLSGWIHAVAIVKPLTRVLEAGRGFVAGSPTQVAAAYGAAAGLGVLFSWWAVRGLRKAEAVG
jgi:hypothetical protein